MEVYQDKFLYPGVKDGNPTFGAGRLSLLSLRYGSFDVVSYFCKNMSKMCVMQGHPARCERGGWLPDFHVRVQRQR